ERVAAHSTPETMEDALLGIHREGWSLLGVERAQALVIDPRLPEIHEAADEIDDVHASPDLVEECRRVASHYPIFSAATVAPVPPSRASPSREESTRGGVASRSRPVWRRAPALLPWIKRRVARPAMNASSRYFSIRSCASSVLRPINISSGLTERSASGRSEPPREVPFCLRDSKAASSPAPDLMPSGRSADKGTRTVIEPASTVPVTPEIATSRPRRPR